MLRNLTFATKVNLLLFFQILLGSALACGFLLNREYDARMDQLIREAVHLMSADDQTELAVFYHDKQVLDALLTDLLNNPAFTFAAVFGTDGRLIASRQQTGNETTLAATFSDVRKDSRAIDLAAKSFMDTHSQTSYTGVSIPVFSSVKPIHRGQSKEEFGSRLAAARLSSSRYVIGYGYIGIDETHLRYGLIDYGLLIVLCCLAFLLFCLLLSLILTRRLTAPLTKLAELADDISQGKLVASFRAAGSGETRQLANTLNSILTDLNAYRTKMDVSHRLLSMKMQERTEQLSRRNEELNEAVTVVSETKKTLKQLAYYDSLTSLPNRQLFTEQLELMLKLARRNDHLLALLFIDLDNFKRINDTLGHSAGDELLKEVANRLSHCLRESDVISKHDNDQKQGSVSRLGGDEFTIMLYNLSQPEDAGTVAMRLIEELKSPLIIEGHEIVITPSIGIALAPRDADNIENLLKHADTAMYAAKANGKNNFCYFTKDMLDVGVARLSLESDLRKALKRSEWELYYQPQIDVHTGEIVGAEGLVRWIHPEKGLVPPAQFIPLAEEMGLIVELGEWTLVEACRQCIEFQKLGLNLPKISVNVSSVQFNTDFVGVVQQVLEHSGLDPTLLQLELTEGVIMSNAKASVRALHDLKELNVSLSVDDFGTGYSSLSYLSKFPLDELKIDRCFVVDFDKSKRDASLISAIIAMGESLSLRLVAEGVDNMAQFNFLKASGAHAIQGYLFSKPIRASEFAELLANNHFPEQLRRMPRDISMASPQ